MPERQFKCLDHEDDGGVDDHQDLLLLLHSHHDQVLSVWLHLREAGYQPIFINSVDSLPISSLQKEAQVETHP